MSKSQRKSLEKNRCRNSSQGCDPYFISLMNDYSFTQVLKNPVVLQGFLSAAIKEPIEEILHIEVKDRHLNRSGPEGKLGILDVRAYVRDKGDFDLEMQILPFTHWDNRTLFYMSKLFTEGVERGDGYNQCNKVIAINVVNFNYCKEIDYFYSTFHFWHDKDPVKYSDMMEIQLIELCKLDKTEVLKEDQEIYKWAKFIAAENEEERLMIEKDPYIEEALKELEKLSQDPKRKEEYEQRDKALRDYVTLMEYAEERGIAIGREKANIVVAENLLRKDIDYEIIMAATGFSREKIAEIEKDL